MASAARAGSLEEAVRERIDFAVQPDFVENASNGRIHAAYKDAAEAREAINSHMGRLQGLLDERKKRDERLARAEQREGREHERETDPILRPDGQC